MPVLESVLKSTKSRDQGMQLDGSEAALLAADVVAWSMIGCAIMVFPTLMHITAPYGRYGRNGWGPGVPARLAWMTQELPSLLIPAAMLAHSSTQRTLPPWQQLVPLLVFLVHYSWRSLAFPFIMNSSQPTPLSVWLLAFAFCCLNGFQQGANCLLRQLRPASIAETAAIGLGLAIWAGGLAVNIHADLTLCRMRRQNGAGYQIPRGGAFEFVSAANYAGEILEWAGWALAVRTLPAVAFACFTFANLAPRGHHHHRFYRRHFKQQYPKTRKAVVPFVW